MIRGTPADVVAVSVITPPYLRVRSVRADHLLGDTHSLKTASGLVAARSLQRLIEVSPGFLLASQQQQHRDQRGGHAPPFPISGRAYRKGVTERMPASYRAPIVQLR